MSVEKFISEIEELIRGNEDSAAAAQLSRLKPKQIQRRYRAKLANLARRSGLATKSLEILKPVVIEHNHLLESASHEERAEYAQSLYRLGATFEAMRIFKTIDPKIYPKVLLYRSFVDFSQWNYSEAIPNLQEYLSLIDPKSYEGIVANLNLTAALLTDKRIDEAATALAFLEKEKIEANFPRLFANWLELSAQLAIERRNFELARAFLQKGLSTQDATDNMYSLFIKKWECVSNLTNNGPSLSAIANLNEVRDLARKLSHWETLRDCDFIEGRFTKNTPQLTHLFYGTPYPKYRERIQLELPASWKPTETYVRNLVGTPDTPIIRLLPTSDRIFGLKRDSKPIQLLSILNADFYKPLNVGNLFQSLFPEQHFDPDSSANRVHQVLFRLRIWLEEQKLPLMLTELNSTYKLIGTAPVAIEVPLHFESPQAGTFALAQLRQHFQNKEFKAKEASAQLGLEKTASVRLLNEAIDRGELQRLHQGPQTRYRFVKRHDQSQKVEAENKQHHI